MSNRMWVVKTTLPDSWREFEVVSFAQDLLANGAACVQHFQITSTYKWEGEIKSEKEWSVEIKVSNQNKKSVLENIPILHPYDVPQIISFECEASESFLEWVNFQ